ncbi:Ca-transporting ATPase [Mycena olivaceomarginata]|nr:Ca-transporting ATPase [Mycena olivaceomarginata]
MDSTRPELELRHSDGPPAVVLSGSSSAATGSLASFENGTVTSVPPSPTLSLHSSVHFTSTSLALRDNQPESPSALRNVRSDPTRFTPRSRSASRATTTLTQVGSASASRANRDAVAATATDTSPAPFRFRANDLAVMLDPKNLDTLEDMGGIDGLLDGLGTSIDIGLGSETGCSDDCLGAGVGHRPDPAKGEETAVPVITLTAPGGEKTTNWNPTQAFVASLNVRKSIYGENIIPRRPTKSLLSLLYTALKDKVLILLSIAALVSFALEIFQDFGTPRPAEEPHADWVEGIAIMVAIFVVALVGSVNDWQKERQFQTLNDRKDERSVKVIRGGVQTQVVVGDVALLEPGEIVPCDGVFLSGHNVKCDESGATGESDLIKKLAYDECIALRGSEGGTHTDCFIVSGSKVLEGVGKYVVVAVGTKSFNGRIMMALRSDVDNTPLQIKLNDLAEFIAKLGSATGLVLFIALLIRFFVELGTGEPVRTANQKGIVFVNIFVISVALIVVAVPEGLPLAVTLALAFATKRMTYDKLLVRVLGSCETMTNVSVVCTDKTGALTQNCMTVVAGSVGIHAKFVRNLEANTTCTNEYSPRKHANDFSLDLSQLNTVLEPQLRELFNEAIAVNSTAFQDKHPETGEPIFVGSQTEAALLQFAQELQWPELRTTRGAAAVVQMIPFSSERKVMGVVVRTPRGKFRLHLKGASEILSNKCVRHVVVRKEGPSARDSTEEIETAAIDELANDNTGRTTIFYANQTLRTIALCYRDLDSWPTRDEVSYEELAQNLTLIGVLGIEDPLRPGVLEAVKKCQMAGVTVKMCTGDNILTARSTAIQCGIFSPGGIIMEGAVFRDLSLEEKIEIVPRLQVLARSSPKDKKILVETLKHIGQVVGVTGDGANDGPALKTADVGFSMGIMGTEVVKEASDIVLMDDNFASIAKAIIWGRGLNDAVRKFLQFQVSTNVAAVVVTFVSAVASVEESSVLSAVQLLWINIIMDTFAALALATDPATELLLNRKPNEKTMTLFSTEMYKQILFQSTYQIIFTLVFHFAGLEILGFGQSQNAQTAKKNNLIVQTLVFNAFVFAQIFNSVNCRRLDRNLNIFEGILQNWYFIGIILIEIGGQILIVFVGGAAFHVTPIGGQEWGIALALGIGSIPLGAFVRLLPSDPFERLFERVGLLGHADVLPRASPNSDTVEWNAVTRVQHNLDTFINVRGGRVRSSSVVTQNRTARPSQEQARPALSPLTPIISTVTASLPRTQLGSLSDPAHSDPSRSSTALWEGKLQLHSGTDPQDPVYQRFGENISLQPDRDP